MGRTVLASRVRHPPTWGPVSRWSLPDPSTRVATLPDPARRRAPAPKRPSFEGWLLITGGGIAMLGSVLPWSVMTTGDRVHSAAGTTGDGRVTLLLGLILVAAGVLTLLGVAARWLAITAIACAIMLTVIAAYDAVDLSAFGNAGDELASLEMGHGLVITVIGGVLAAVGAARCVARSAIAANW